MNASITYELDGDIALLGINLPEKRNAMSPPVQQELLEAVLRAGEEAKCGILFGHGGNFCSGLDLRWAADQWSGKRARRYYEARTDMRDAIGRGAIPFVAALHGATLGGGLETACAAHVRVADETAFFALPEGTRGIYVGGGGSVRVARVIGFSRMQEMMLTGRVVRVDEAERWGIAHYVVPAGQALGKAKELALKICANTELANYAITNGLPRLQDMSYGEGLFFERMVSEFARSPESMERLRSFLDKSAPRVKKEGS